MNILHVVPSFYPATSFGGPIWSTYGLCNALARKRDISLKVLTSDTAGPTRHERLRSESIRAELFPGYTVDFQRKWASTAVAPGFVSELPRLMQWADVVHVTAVYSFSTIPALAACRAWKKPVVWSCRGALQRWEHTRKRPLKMAWERTCATILAGHPHAIHVTSPEEGQAARTQMPNSPIVEIPNGVDIPESLAPRPWQPEGKTRVLFLGRFDPIKGIENLVDAVALSKVPALELSLCGSGDATYTASLAKRIEEKGLSSSVKLAGFVEGAAKARAFANADICVLPSFSENFGMVVVEALSHGVPVIASRGTPWKDLQSRECGLWVQNDPASLARAMDDLAQKNLEAMGQRGRAWMCESFDWNAVAGRMAEVYHNLREDSRFR
ncbi:MAG: glycosyltransferase [Polyangiaceae bacterium]|nr:glycosyltransferase [Polyangiaceae bacterium]